MSDQSVLAFSSLSGDAPEQFQSKQWIYQNDNNASSYNGQISFDLSSFSNSGRWINWSEAILTIPVVFGYKTSGDSSSTPAALAVGLKSGFHHLIHSFELQFGNTSVQQLTGYTNMFTSFKMLTTFCQDTAHKYGALLNFFKDEGKNYRYSAAASGRGKGVSCNDIVLSAPILTGANAYPALPNEGFLKRLYNTNLPSEALTGLSFIAQDQLRQLGISQFRGEGSGAARVYYTEAIATIRLKDISDFIAKLGLCKGAFVKLTLNTNSGIVTADIDASDLLDAKSAKAVVQGGTFPAMIAAAVLGSPSLVPVQDSTSGTITIGCGIASLSLPGGAVVTNSLQKSCRIYVPTYVMMPEVEQGFLESNPVREIVYHDLYQYTISAVDGPFNQLVSNGIVGAQYVVVCPIVSAQSNGTGGSVSPLISPFASEPATTSGGSWIQEYNVQVSGSNIYMQNVKYGWENFLEEVSSINALNGGLSDEMSSGLIGYDDWNTCYRYYVTDISRGTPMDMSVPKSIQVQGTIPAGAKMDLFVFVVYKRRLTIRTADSAIVA